MRAAQFAVRIGRTVKPKRIPVLTVRWSSTEVAPAEVPPINFTILPEEPTPVSPLQKLMKPKQVVDELNQYIVGQADAKRAVAVALRNRWRRQQLGEDMRNEVIPKNILMIGPTGCGKTEIARRMAKLCEAPFIKVEATKFTEVGFHGKDVDTIIKDLVDVSINMTRRKMKEQVKDAAAAAAEEKILITLVGTNMDARSKESFREQLRNGELEDHTIDIEIPPKSNGQDKGGMAISFDNAKDIISHLTRAAAAGPKRKDTKKLKISEARPLLEDAEADRLLEDVDLVREAITAVEESGIVFIDEIDKIVSSGDYRGADASSEGVQRDLLPLIEGSSISTKYGNVNTDFVLFIASGAFHTSKPSDLLAELQGRLPIRVTLKGLTEEDMYRILTEPKTNLIYQQVQLMRSENVELIFTDDAIREVARVAFLTNRTVENIGARRLHTVIERVMEEISFDAPDRAGERVEITADYVKTRVGDLMLNTDMRKYIL